MYLFRPITEVCCQDEMLVCIEDPDEEFSIIPSRAINDGIATMIPKTPEQFIEIKGTVSVITNFMQWWQCPIHNGTLYLSLNQIPMFTI